MNFAGKFFLIPIIPVVTFLFSGGLNGVEEKDKTLEITGKIARKVGKTLD